MVNCSIALLQVDCFFLPHCPAQKCWWGCWGTCAQLETETWKEHVLSMVAFILGDFAVDWNKRAPIIETWLRLFLSKVGEGGHGVSPSLTLKEWQPSEHPVALSVFFSEKWCIWNMKSAVRFARWWSLCHNLTCWCKTALLHSQPKALSLSEGERLAGTSVLPLCRHHIFSCTKCLF